MKFFLKDHSGPIFINSLERLTQLVNLLRRGHLHEHVHGSPFEQTFALVALQALDDVLVELRSFSGELPLLLVFEPGVLERLLPVEALLRGDDEEVPDEVFAFVAHHVELFVVKVEVS